VSRDRIDRLVAELDGLGAESFLVTHPVNVFWLTGFESSNAACLVSADSVVLATDGRYIEAARHVDGVEPLQSERNLTAWMAGKLGDLARGGVAFEADHVTVAQYEPLRESGVQLVPTKGTLKGIRAVKSAEELDAIRASAAVNDAMYQRLAEESLVGRTEADVAWWIVQTLHEEGADAVGFDPIVAGGPSAALPHHHPGERPIGPNETVIVDAGATVDGYRSDCTRTFATGDLPAQLEEAYGLVAQAQLDGLAAVRPGAFGPDVDAASRVAIVEAGLADAYGHGLGHGVGLDIHEAPNLRPESTDTLAVGNVVTVEPGLYLPRIGGCRIEDLVVVTDDGCEILSSFTKEMLVVA
jgi:Xaa-Pro aminopeptidase